jgi:hypothetical protein
MTLQGEDIVSCGSTVTIGYIVEYGGIGTKNNRLKEQPWNNALHTA